MLETGFGSSCGLMGDFWGSILGPRQVFQVSLICGFILNLIYVAAFPIILVAFSDSLALSASIPLCFVPKYLLRVDFGAVEVSFRTSPPIGFSVHITRHLGSNTRHPFCRGRPLVGQRRRPLQMRAERRRRSGRDERYFVSSSSISKVVARASDSS